jgi:SAM-dependent methyltransferase
VKERESNRTGAFGQTREPSFIDRFGVWLSARKIRGTVPAFEGLRIADLGCGYDATIARQLLPDVREAVLVDLALADSLKTHPKVAAREGTLPDVLCDLPDASLDLVMCLSVLEHLWEPQRMLSECRRLLAPGGTLLVNVPSWRGKRALEFSAFRLRLSPAEEMNDHKTYYDPKDLWPLLVRVGFTPEHIRCTTHKFGLNTFAICVVES